MNRQRLHALILMMALVVCAPMAAWADTDAPSGAPTPASMNIGYSLTPDTTPITIPSQAGLFHSKLNSVTDTDLGVRGITSVTRRVDTYYSDTIALTTDGGQTPSDTKRQVLAGDTGTYILSVTNRGNAPDSIGFVIDTFMVNGWLHEDTAIRRWTMSFYDSRGAAVSGYITKRSSDTILMRLNPNATETFTLRIYADTDMEETSWINFRLRSYVGNGNPQRFAVRAYRGFNGDTFGGDGHDSMQLFAEIKLPARIRMAMTDTVFTPVALGGGATDTQRYIPGSMMVHTLWFENDGTDTADTLYAEFWIDTRHLMFDSAGLRIGSATQIAAAGTYVINNYGNIFLDSAMPTFATTGFNVQIFYSAGDAPVTPLTSATPLANVGRIRWVITRTGGVLAATNGDDVSTIDAAPIDPTATGDVDRGFVRFAVVIK